jgi:hypothetical protein
MTLHQWVVWCALTNGPAMGSASPSKNQVVSRCSKVATNASFQSRPFQGRFQRHNSGLSRRSFSEGGMTGRTLESKDGRSIEAAILLAGGGR